MKNKIFGVLQRVGRSFMLPIAMLPIAGLLLGLGSLFTDETTITTYGLNSILGSGTVLHALFVIMNKVGSAIFTNLPLFFAVGIAIGMAKREKSVSALSAVMAYFVMHTSINAMLQLTGRVLEDGTISEDVLYGTITESCGILTLQMGVFGGIVVGLGVAALHNKFYKIELPNALSFFGGTRFVPIVSTVVYMFVGILMYFIWPTVQNGIYALGGLVTGTGYVGTLIFGLIKRALLPFGLHHVFYMPFWQTAVGGTMEVAGEMVHGGQNIFFAQLADSAHISHFSSDATRYFSGEFIFMMFGLPGGALAMYHCAKPEKKKQVGGLLISASLVCILTGITESLEFSFLFVAPVLFIVQVVLAGSAYMIAHMLNIAVGLTFSGGLLDFILFGILPGNEKTSWMLVIPVGIVYFFLYYFIFSFCIRKFDCKTPGREDEDEVKLYTRKDMKCRENSKYENNTKQNENLKSEKYIKSNKNPECQKYKEHSEISRCEESANSVIRYAEDTICKKNIKYSEKQKENEAYKHNEKTSKEEKTKENKTEQEKYGTIVAKEKLCTEEKADKKEKLSTEEKISTKEEISAEEKLSAKIAKGLGGEDNILDLDCCVTRLRCTVIDSDDVDEELLRETGATGVVKNGQGVQIIYGPQVPLIKSNLEDYLDSGVWEQNAAVAEKETIILERKKRQIQKKIQKKKKEKVKEVVRTIIIGSPATGEAADLSKVPDAAFANKMMGDGAAILPLEPLIVAPDDGETSFIFSTKHALGFLTDSGVSILIHVGVDTVRLGGKGFEVLAEPGQKVKKGEPILKLDLDYLNANTSSLMSPVLCTELKENEKIRLLKEGEIKSTEAFFAIDIYE